MIELKVYSRNILIYEALSKFSLSIKEVEISLVKEVISLNLTKEFVVFYVSDDLEFKEVFKYFKECQVSPNSLRFLFIFNRDVGKISVNSLNLNVTQIILFPSNRKREISHKFRKFVFTNRLLINKNKLEKKYNFMKNFLHNHLSTDAIQKIFKDSNKDFIEKKGDFIIIYFKILNIEDFFYLEIEKLFNLLSDIYTDIIDLTSKQQGMVLNIIGDSAYLVFGYQEISQENQIRNSLNCCMDMEKFMTTLNKYNPYDFKKNLAYNIAVVAGQFYFGKMDSVKYKNFNILGKDYNEIFSLINLKNKNERFYHNIVFNKNFRDNLLKFEIYKNTNKIINLKDTKQPIEAFSILKSGSSSLDDGFAKT